ncbi:MAG: phytoene dehydrogenase-like protein [Planctomycetota bacterium]|jgi:phytoene dehydrogenase-like protein
MSPTAQPRTERFDTVIIGAGMSGLAAGIRLAQFDQRVLIVEKHYLWGGLNSFYKRAGRRIDVGLHALTNYIPAGKAPGRKRRPLSRILRQLRIAHADLELGQQSESCVAFPSERLRFSNDIELLTSEVERAFPSQRDGFALLLDAVVEYPSEDGQRDERTAREVLAGMIDDPLLIDMLLLPILYYGSPTPNDLAWTSFITLFKSLYEEGFARPRGGVKTLLDLLRSRYKELGGELRMSAGVERIEHKEGTLEALVLENGDRIEAGCVLSSAGWVETLGLAGLQHEVKPSEYGALSFVESISILDRPTRELGHDTTITFFNSADRLVYAPPESDVDFRSGVICCPDNYQSPGALEEPALRLTLLANAKKWAAKPEDQYVADKESVWQQGHAAITPFAPDIREHTIYKDLFTPRTITHYTGHPGGAIYGSPIKRPSGETPIHGLYLCGTDQGFLGIVGSMLSGIAMANLHALQNA